MLFILALLCITSPILCQDAMEPDVTFGDQNDRFDVGAIIQQSRSYFNDEPSYQSRIESSMRSEDGVMDGFAERRSGVKRRMKVEDGLPDAVPQRRSRIERSKRANDQIAEAIPQRRSRIESNMRAEDDLINGIQERRSGIESSVREEEGLTDGVPQRRSRIERRMQVENSLAEILPRRRQDYANHDSMEPDKDPERADYETNLKAYAQNNKKGRRFKNIIDDLHAGKHYRSRRNDEKLQKEFIDPDLEIMMHHAVPINAKFQGYLTAPLVE